jgi:hypothetical protein
MADSGRLSMPMSQDVHATRLLGMVAALEEAIIRFEERRGDPSGNTVSRLRLVQGEILTSLELLELRHHSSDDSAGLS